MIFCTLFDSNYLDKGLALYESMKTNLAEFTLYILIKRNYRGYIVNVQKQSFAGHALHI